MPAGSFVLLMVERDSLLSFSFNRTGMASWPSNGVLARLQMRGEEINYISSPQEGEIGVEMLRVLAKEEQEELQASA